MIEFLSLTALAAFVYVLAAFGRVKPADPVVVPAPVRNRRRPRR